MIRVINQDLGNLRKKFASKTKYHCVCITHLCIVSILMMSLFTFYASSVFAATDCYDERYYPSVLSLKKTDKGINVVLGGQYADYKKRTTPTLSYIEGHGWNTDKPVACEWQYCFYHWENKCQNEIPEITLSLKDAIDLRQEIKVFYDIEQKISACTERDGFVWFGIRFYQGEGTNGVGGVGRYNPKTKQIETRRPPLLLDSSIKAIVHDGESLWFGTTGEYECLGDTPMHGLVRYKWDSSQIETFEGKDDGPCGFVVHDLLWDNNKLWVATDLGLSLWDAKKGKWYNYVPNPEKTPPMYEIKCEVLYKDLLKVLPKSLTQDFGSFYNLLGDALIKFRPNAKERYEIEQNDWQ
ncbi:MAG: hypothetical protein WA162_07865 [Thermodesulfobacteriota bacterium]